MKPVPETSLDIAIDGGADAAGAMDGLARSLAAAGHRVVMARGWSGLQAAAPELVIIPEARRPRLLDCPTLAVMTAGLDGVFQDRRQFDNMLGCDAVLAMDMAGEAMVEALAVGLGRRLSPGPNGLLAGGTLVERLLAPLPRPAPDDAPLISVIIRCGGRAVSLVRRATESVARQDAGRFEIVFVRHQPLDLAHALPRPAGAIACHRIVDVAPGSRAAALQAGIDAARGEFIAVLDDDDWWLRHHIRCLLAGRGRRPAGQYFAYSGSIAMPVGDGAGEPWVYAFGMRAGQDWQIRNQALVMNAWLASAGLCRDYAGRGTALMVGEDALLQLQMMGRAEPWFSHAATAVFSRGRDDHSVDWAGPSEAVAADLRMNLARIVARVGPDLPGPQPGPDWWTELRRCWLGQTDLPALLGCLPDLTPPGQEPAAVLASGLNAERCNCPPPSLLADAATGEVTLECDGPRMSHLAYLALPAHAASHGAVAEIELTVTRGILGFWLWDHDEVKALSHAEATAATGRAQLRLRLPAPGSHGRIVVFQKAEGRSAGTIHAVRVVAG